MIFGKSIDYILNTLHTNAAFVEAYSSCPTQADTYFNKWHIRKKDGSARIVYEAKNEQLRNVYVKLQEELNQYNPKLHEAAHGFIKGHSTKTNAALHLGKNYILNLDLADFFGTITQSQVRQAYRRLGATEDVGDVLANLCTLAGKLPQGIQTSPALANHCFYECDVELAIYATAHGMVYSRYADDITFSSDSRIDKSPITAIISNYDFRIAPHKTKLQKRGSNQYVTGLTVFDGVTPRVSKRYKKNLRLELHLVGILGIEEYAINRYSYPSAPHHGDDMFSLWQQGLKDICSTEFERIKGKVCYIHAIEPERAKEMWRMLNTVDMSVLDA
jgi:RNA-directed DNA polymerase